MLRVLKEEELDGRMDCFGNFDAFDEICLKYCGLNISCASANYDSEDDYGWLEEEVMELPDMDLD